MGAARGRRWHPPRPWTWLLLAAAAVAVAWPAVTRHFLRLQYPLAYRREIYAGAGEFGLHPMLVAAVIRNESRFFAEARSKRGALGLMQVMPATGHEAAAQLGIDGFRPGMLYDPAINVRIGSYLLARYRQDFSGDLVLALAAYNAGPATVRRWLLDAELTRRDPAGEGVTLAEIPYRETRGYVWRVLRDFERYRHLYGP